MGQLKGRVLQRHIWPRLEGHNPDITANPFNAALPHVLITKTEWRHKTNPRTISRVPPTLELNAPNTG